MFHFTEKLSRLLHRGFEIIFFQVNASLPIGGLVFRGASLGLCLTHQLCRWSAACLQLSSPAAIAGKRSGYGVSGNVSLCEAVGTLGDYRNRWFLIADVFLTHTDCPIAHIPVVYDVPAHLISNA